MTDENKPDRAGKFLRLHESLPQPGTVKIPAPPTAPTSDKFLKRFNILYQRTPGAYKNKAPDQASQLVQTRLVAQLLDELRILTSALKPKV